MKYLISVLMVLLFTATASAQSLWGNAGIKSQEYVYDFAVDGGASGATIDLAKGKTLPVNALLLDAYYHVKTAFTSGGSAVVALGDAADTGSIVSATAYNNSAYALASLVKDASGSPRVCSATSCNPRIAITGAALTAGKVTIHMIYVMPKN